MKRELVYIACPYSHENETIMEFRTFIATTFSAKLMNDGELGAFSPIVYLHSVNKIGELPSNWNFWKEILRTYLQYSKKLIVLVINGWEESEGVQAEIEIAREMDIPIEYVNPHTDVRISDELVKNREGIVSKVNKIIGKNEEINKDE